MIAELGELGAEEEGGKAAGLARLQAIGLPVPPALVALRVTDDVPAVVGVPEIKPVAVLIDKPAGNPAAL